MSRGVRHATAVACVYLIAGGLTACGGSSSEGPKTSETPKTPSISKAPLAVSLSEDQTITRELDGIIDADSIRTIIDNPAVDVAAEGKTLSIVIGEVENDGIARFVVRTGADTEYTVNVDIDNASADPLVEQASTLTSDAADRLILEDELRLQEVLAELEYMAKELTEKEKLSGISNAESVASGIGESVKTKVEALTQALEGYKKGEITETSLDQALQAAQSIVTAYGEAGEQILDGHTATLAALGLAIPQDLNEVYPLKYVPEIGRYTRFTHQDFGEMQGDSFAFNADHDFLNTVLTYAK